MTQQVQHEKLNGRIKRLESEVRRLRAGLRELRMEPWMIDNDRLIVANLLAGRKWDAEVR